MHDQLHSHDRIEREHRQLEDDIRRSTRMIGEAERQLITSRAITARAPELAEAGQAQD